ncbi:telomere-protecting terminal protein Tpg [Streptomyces sulphureus]|uniref:telomere-protecting terminal protein Tpg n=1 Tax=Streptomyces sulphureus TaxID=47758 RepID=UPI000368F1AB|nr:helix-turn-helix domain-containing protein [Streptomyces sulphureus]
MGVFDDALERATQQAVTTPLPTTAPARMRHLVAHLGTAAAAARALGTSATTVRRYMRGASRTPRPELAAALERELRRHWKPGLRRAALKRAEREGFTVEARARFGYSAPGGTTNEPRLRLITQYIPPASARDIVAAHRRGDPEQEQQQRLVDALAFHYFRDGGRRAHGLQVGFGSVDHGAEFGDIDYIDVDL